MLEIQNCLGGDRLFPLTRGGVPLSCSPPLVPSALDGCLRRTTFKYAATALILYCNRRQQYIGRVTNLYWVQQPGTSGGKRLLVASDKNLLDSVLYFYRRQQFIGRVTNLYWEQQPGTSGGKRLLVASDKNLLVSYIVTGDSSLLVKWLICTGSSSRGPVVERDSW